MGSQTLTNLLDTHVGQDQPNTNYNLGGSVYVRQWAGSIRVAYLYFSRPFPLGATITSAKLHLYGYAKPVAGTIQLYLRRLNQQLVFPKVTWNGRATAFLYPEATASKSSVYPDREEWEFDIQPQMQAVSDGAKWYGFQLGSDWATETWSPRFMSANHPNPDLRPWVEVTWSDAPDTPTQLAPSGGRVVSDTQPILRFDYSDVSGDTDQANVHVQLHTSATFTAPLYDSGVQPATEPQWDLTGSTFTATAGTVYYWRVRVQDGAGLWSGWSAAASFSYQPLPTITIDAPALPPNNFVEEPTPPMTWSVTSGTQQSYQLGLHRLDGSRWVLLWYRDRTVDPTADGFRPPAGLITRTGATYRFDLRVWDDYDREAIPNGRAFATLSREFTYQYSALTSPVTDLEAAPADPYPGIVLTWERATMPDSYAITRDGEIIASGLDPDDDAHVGGTSYSWTDRFPIKGQEHTYSVQAVVNAKASDANPTVAATNRILGTWLVDAAEGGPAVCMVKDTERAYEFGEDSATYAPLGASTVSVVTQSLRAYSGNQAGRLKSGMGGTAETAGAWRARLLDLKSRPGTLVYLFTTGMTIPVVLQNIQVSPTPLADRTYTASFDWHQQGLLPFVPIGLL